MLSVQISHPPSKSMTSQTFMTSSYLIRKKVFPFRGHSTILVAAAATSKLWPTLTWPSCTDPDYFSVDLGRSDPGPLGNCQPPIRRRAQGSRDDRDGYHRSRPCRMDYYRIGLTGWHMGQTQVSTC